MLKHLRLYVLLFSLTAISVGAYAPCAKAQTKVGYIDASKILKKMPEVKDAQSRLDQLSSSWTKEATEMQAEIDRKQADYDRRKLIMTDAERSSSELDLSNLRKKHEDYIHQKFDETGGELFAQEAVFMKPAYDKLTNAIKEAAQDGNYDYVFDRSSKDIVLLYSNTKYDLTIVVARKLGIESEVLTTKLVQNTPNQTQGAPAPGTANKPGQTAGPNQPPPPGQGIMPGMTPPTPLTPGNPNNPNPNPPPTQAPGPSH